MEKIVEEIIEAVNGKENISVCTNCLTRLRLTLKDSSLADHAQLKELTGVFGVVEVDEVLQIVVGPGKAQQASDAINQLFA